MSHNSTARASEIARKILEKHLDDIRAARREMAFALSISKAKASEAAAVDRELRLISQMLYEDGITAKMALDRISCHYPNLKPEI